MKEGILKILIIFIVSICGGIFADQILWPYFVERPLFHQYNLEQNPVYVTERKEVIVQENEALQGAIEKVNKAVVGIRTKTDQGVILNGSGLILTSDGLMVTLADLVPQSSDFSFFVEGEIVGFQILRRDLKNNLALIKINKENLSTVGFADISKLKLGERVFLVGVNNPVTKGWTVNEGIVKSFDEELIQTNIRDEISLSGSSLFNIAGESLGLNIVDKQGKVATIPIIKIKTFAGF